MSDYDGPNLLFDDDPDVGPEDEYEGCVPPLRGDTAPDWDDQLAAYDIEDTGRG